MGIKGDRDETEVSVDKDGYEQDLKEAKAKARADNRTKAFSDFNFAKSK